MAEPRANVRGCGCIMTLRTASVRLPGNASTSQTSSGTNGSLRVAEANWGNPAENHLEKPEHRLQVLLGLSGVAAVKLPVEDALLETGSYVQQEVAEEVGFSPRRQRTGQPGSPSVRAHTSDPPSHLEPPFPPGSSVAVTLLCPPSRAHTGRNETRLAPPDKPAPGEASLPRSDPPGT